MFSQIMLVQQFLLHGWNARLKYQSVEVHERDLLQYHSIVNGVHGIGAPCEWTMAVNEHGGNCVGIFPLEDIPDHQPCFLFIFALNLFFCHLAGTRDFAVEIIAMCCTKRRNTASCLSKTRCPTAVGVYDTADVRKGFI